MAKNMTPDQAEVLQGQLKWHYASDGYQADDYYNRLSNLDGGVHVHEDSFFKAGLETEIANVGVLRHLVLYCDHVLVRDPLAEAVNRYSLSNLSNEGRPLEQRLADALRQLLPVAELVRSGCFILSGNLGVEMEADGPLSLSARVFFDWRDPLMDHAISQFPEKRLEKLRSFSRGETEWEDEYEIWFTEMLRKIYPVGASSRDVRSALNFTSLRTYPLTPIVSNPVVKYHLQQYSRLLLGQRPQSGHEEVSPLSPAISYQVPVFGDSLDDIIRLRQNERVFAEVRTALVKLGKVCAASLEASGKPESYEAYTGLVGEYAEDIVRPAFEAVQRLQRQAAMREFLPKAALKSCTFGIDFFVCPGLGTTVDMACEPLIGRKAARAQKDARVAGGILKSLLRY
ncbi:MAG: hypothetical protein JO266_16565 [Acidobacteria bacterium]|nr:hypothetical protein [Acidobacteriota bacterium]MBV9479508.1 hypothetical protein [Acidobacteriota bacterium]